MSIDRSTQKHYPRVAVSGPNWQDRADATLQVPDGGVRSPDGFPQTISLSADDGTYGARRRPATRGETNLELEWDEDNIFSALKPAKQQHQQFSQFSQQQQQQQHNNINHRSGRHPTHTHIPAAPSTPPADQQSPAEADQQHPQQQQEQQQQQRFEGRQRNNYRADPPTPPSPSANAKANSNGNALIPASALSSLSASTSTSPSPSVSPSPSPTPADFPFPSTLTAARFKIPTALSSYSAADLPSPHAASTIDGAASSATVLKTLRKKPSRYRQRSPRLRFRALAAGPYYPDQWPNANLNSIVTRSADPLVPRQKSDRGAPVVNSARGLKSFPHHLDLVHSPAPFRGGDENSSDVVCHSPISSVNHDAIAAAVAAANQDDDDLDLSLRKALTLRTLDSAKSFAERTTGAAATATTTTPTTTTATRATIVTAPASYSTDNLLSNYQPYSRPKNMTTSTTRWVDAPTSFGGTHRDADHQHHDDAAPMSPKSKIKSPIFAFLSRSRKGDLVSAAPASPGRAPETPQLGRPAASRALSRRVAGRVVVRCMNSSITLPITPTTTPVDILHSAANLITHRIRPESSIVVESYLQYGLERRLRRYELHPDGADPVPDNPELLESVSVPRTYEPPYAFTLQMYHCARVGKWTKRVITLLDTGQIFAAKKPGAQPSDKDSVSLCHLSDFDLYTPTEHQSHVFPNGENFVHFFCTDDSRMARLFREQVHGWRSWYLVNRKLEADPPSVGRKASQRSVGRNGARQSVDTPYAIGTFKPLMDMDIFEKSYDDPTASDPAAAAAAAADSPSRLDASQAPLQGKPAPDHEQDLTPTPDFDAKGLLGQGYEERKQEQLRRTGTQRRRASIDEDGPLPRDPAWSTAFPRPRTSSRIPSPRARGLHGPPPRRITLPAHHGRREPPAQPASPRGPGEQSSASVRTTRTVSGARRTAPHDVSPPPGMPKPLLDFHDNPEEPAPRGGTKCAWATPPSAASSSARNHYAPQHQHQHQQQSREGPFVRHPQGETLLGQLERSQSVASSSSRYRAARRARGDEEPMPPLPPQGTTLLGQLEARQVAAAGSRSRSGTVR
ncbi:unnamed protein product [Parascedosporium putredinis]|uniref:PH domain-containing protein n=1 Tax=Parascedosporium putredinis TaxID=1442378 RepID=A0A9P1M8N2_9PEZI|nr:unnamed protein product [Parascedosporium putredinis]CAI7993037.1 unnamed protein product [Parascedosporium putredinis]